MTVSALGGRFTYAGNGTTKAFSFPRRLMDDDELKVYLVDTSSGASTLKVKNVDYSIVIAGGGGSATVTFTTAPLSSQTVLLYRDTDGTQNLDIANAGVFPSESIEDALDRLSTRIDDAFDRIGRTLRIGDADSPLTTLTSLPGLSLRAGYILGFDSDGDPKVYSVGELSEQYAGVVARMKVVNPMEDRFGGVGNGSTVDNDAVDAAIAEVVVGGGILQITNLHRVTGLRTISSAYPVAVVGIEARVSGFVHSGSTGCLKISVPTWGDWAPRVENIGFFKTGSGTSDTALEIRSETDLGASPGAVSGSDKGGIVTGCSFDIWGDAAGYWNAGVVTHNMPHVRIVGNWIAGRTGLTTTKSGYGVRLGFFSQGSSVSDNKIRGFKYGVGTYEGELFNQSARQNSTAYTTGQKMLVTTGTARKYIFICDTAGTTAGSEPAGYATVGEYDTITDGFATFYAQGMECEGIEVFGNTITNCDDGVSADLRDVEICWRIYGNAIDVTYNCVRLRNLTGAVVNGNVMGWNGQHTDHADVRIVTDDGAAVPTRNKTLNANTIVSNNYSFRSGDLDLTINGVTRGATTVLSYSKTAGNPAPANGDKVFVYQVNGTTELNLKSYIVANHSATNSTSGTFEVTNYYTGAAIDSSGYGAFSGSGQCRRHSAFLEVEGGQEITCSDNIITNRSAMYHLWAETQDIEISNNRKGSLVLTTLINASSYPTTLSFRSMDSVLQIRQSATRTLTSNTSAQALFDAAANGAFTLTEGDIVDIDLLVSLTNLSSSSSDFSFGLAGTATLADISLCVTAMKNTAANAARHSLLTSATATVVVNATVATEGFIRVLGSFRVTASGTVIPQITQSVASAAVIGVGSYCRMTRQPPVQTYGAVS